jgi:hypothetical protein
MAWVAGEYGSHANRWVVRVQGLEPVRGVAQQGCDRGEAEPRARPP